MKLIHKISAEKSADIARDMAIAMINRVTINATSVHPSQIGTRAGEIYNTCFEEIAKIEYPE
jgi:hypothetical protein